MERYFRTLHRQPPEHKKRVAFLTASTITLLIFGVWSLSTFPQRVDQSVAWGNDNSFNVNDTSPFKSLRTNVANSLSAIRSNVNELKTDLESVNLESEYNEMKSGAMEIYGE